MFGSDKEKRKLNDEIDTIKTRLDALEGPAMRAKLSEISAATAEMVEKLDELKTKLEASEGDKKALAQRIDDLESRIGAAGTPHQDT